MHVDSLSPLPSSTEQLPSRRGKGRQESIAARSTERITDVFASTRAYPSWWSEIEEHKVFRRRRSMGDTVLERNLCFVDTPGYSREMSMVEGMEPIIQYIEAQLAKAFSPAHTTEGELVSMLGGDGGAQVDLVLYLLHRRMLPRTRHFQARANIPPRSGYYGVGLSTTLVSFNEHHTTDF